MKAPSAYQLERIVSLAQQTLDRLRNDEGLVLETDFEIFGALADEGSDAEDILCRMIAAAQEAEQNATRAGRRIADLKLRKARFEAQEVWFRDTAVAIMQAMDLRTYRGPEYTLTITRGRPKVIITDETQLPDSVVDTEIVRTPVKALIKAALDRNETVPGATYSNAGPQLTVTVRTK